MVTPNGVVPYGFRAMARLIERTPREAGRGHHLYHKKDSYGNPGVLNIYTKFKQAIEIKIPDNTDPSLAIDKFATHFGRLAENGVIIGDHLQGMMLLSKLPPSMEAIARLMCQESDIKKITILVVRRAILMGWEQRSGAKNQP